MQPINNVGASSTVNLVTSSNQIVASVNKASCIKDTEKVIDFTELNSQAIMALFFMVCAVQKLDQPTKLSS